MTKPSLHSFDVLGLFQDFHCIGVAETVELFLDRAVLIPELPKSDVRDRKHTLCRDCGEVFSEFEHQWSFDVDRARAASFEPCDEDGV